MADDLENGLSPERDHELWCPSCVTTVGDAPTCPNCGLPQLGATPARLRVIAARVHEAETERSALAIELQRLHDEQAGLLHSLRGPAGRDRALAGTPRGTGRDWEQLNASGDWRPERVRDVLLWLGSALLILSAITFLVVAWARFSPIERAGVLAGGTVIAGSFAFAFRTRLRATAEALTALTLGLAIVDWRALERTSLSHGISTAAWWAIGLGLVGLVTGILGRRSTLTTLRIAPIFALPAAAISGLVALSLTYAQSAIGLALVATITTSIHARRRQQGSDDGITSAVAFVATIGQLATMTLAGIAVIRPIADASPHPVRSLAGPALAILAIAAAPLAALLIRRANPPSGVTTDGFATIVTLAVLGAATAAVEPSFEAHTTVAIVAGMALIATLTARLLPQAWRSGTTFGAALAFGPALVGATNDVTAAWFDPVRWLTDPWAGSLGADLLHHLGPTVTPVVHDPLAVIASLAAVAIAVFVGATRNARGRSLGGVALAMALAIGIAELNPTIGVAFAVHLTLAVALAIGGVTIAERRPALARHLLIGAAAVVVPAVGWAAVSESATIVGVGVVTIASAIALRVRSTDWSRVGAASLAAAGVIAETGFVVHALGATDAVTGFSIFVAAALVLLTARYATAVAGLEIPLEVVAFFGGFFGAATAATSPTWRAITLGVCVPLFVAAGRAHDERSEGYDILAMFAACATSVSLVDHVDAAVEWFSIPAAAIAIAAGLTNRSKTRTWSWSTFGPGLIVGLAPSVAIAVQDGGALRPITVVVTAGVTVFLGARANLRAPIVIGAAALLVLAIDGVAPLAAQLPRWLLIGGIGALALWAGATADRRLDQLRRWRSAIDQLA